MSRSSKRGGGFVFRKIFKSFERSLTKGHRQDLWMDKKTKLYIEIHGLGLTM